MSSKQVVGLTGMSKGMFVVARSAAFAALAHAGQTRKLLPEPYINHPLRVASMAAELGCSAKVIGAANLHDVVEDTPITLAELRFAFPDEPDMIAIVDAVTKWWRGKTHATTGAPVDVEAAKREYYDKICATYGAPVLKVLDRIDNLRDMSRTAHLSPSANRWAREYLAKTLTEFGRVLQAMDRAAEPWSDEVSTARRVREAYDVATAELANRIASY